MPSHWTISAVIAFAAAATCVAGPRLGVAEAGGAGPEPRDAPRRVQYQAPVPGPVIDPFRPPATPYGPGNRGLDYRTTPTELVRAAGPGTVIFAGQVAGRLAVVVLHGDNLRTSYVGVATIDVRTGEPVAGGQPLAKAGDRLQFGVRAGTAYLDPAVLIEGGRGVVRLVPDR